MEVGFRYILKRIFIRILLQQIRLSGYFKHGSVAPFYRFVLLYTIIHALFLLSIELFTNFRLLSGRMLV